MEGEEEKCSGILQWQMFWHKIGPKRPIYPMGVATAFIHCVLISSTKEWSQSVLSFLNMSFSPQKRNRFVVVSRCLNSGTLITSKSRWTLSFASASRGGWDRTCRMKIAIGIHSVEVILLNQSLKSSIIWRWEKERSGVCVFYQERCVFFPLS